jgi:hypothetical protein
MSNTLIEVGQAIGGYASLVAVVVAAVAVWITYRLRPMRMRSIELHSEQLKKAISDWIDKLDNPPSPEYSPQIPSTCNYIEQIPEPEIYALSLETDILFRDLNNHLPRSLFDKWKQYKSMRNEYLKMGQHLTQQALHFATETTGLKIFDDRGPLPYQEDTMLAGIIQCLFHDFYAISRGEEPHFIVEPKFEDGILKRGAYGIIRCVSDPERRSREFHSTLCQALKGTKASVIADDFKEFREQFDTLCQKRQNLAAELSEWLKVPILPNECALLKKGAS